jgi:hypothetical protein
MTVDSKETATKDVQLQLADLVAVLSTIQLAASRGAFRPEEFTELGGLYSRLFAFLESTGAVSRPDAQGQEKGNQS